MASSSFGRSLDKTLKESFSSREEAKEAVREMSIILGAEGDELWLSPFVDHKSGLRCLGVHAQGVSSGEVSDERWALIGVNDPETRTENPVVIRGIQAVVWLAWDAVKGRDLARTVTMTLDDKGIPIDVDETWDLVPYDYDCSLDSSRKTYRRPSGARVIECVYAELEYQSRCAKFEDANMLDIIADLDNHGLIGYATVTIKADGDMFVGLGR